MEISEFRNLFCVLNSGSNQKLFDNRNFKTLILKLMVLSKIYLQISTYLKDIFNFPYTESSKILKIK
jgi:hypothetical protein